MTFKFSPIGKDTVVRMEDCLKYMAGYSGLLALSERGIEALSNRVIIAKLYTFPGKESAALVFFYQDGSDERESGEGYLPTIPALTGLSRSERASLSARGLKMAGPWWFASTGAMRAGWRTSLALHT